MKVFYRGNTWQEQGDIAVLSGDQVGREVDRVCVERFADKEPRESVFIRQTYYDHTAYRAAHIVCADADAGKGVEVPIVQKTADAVKFALPQKNGIYRVMLYSGDRLLGTEILNLPVLQTVLGDAGDSTAPGGLLRVAGPCLCPPGAPYAPRLCLKNENGTFILLPAEQDSPYMLTFRLPENMPCGDYEITVHNGFGDGRCWAEPRRFTVAPTPESLWPKEVFNVCDYGAKGIGAWHNDTAAILKAVQAVRENGGGVLYFPQGNYTLAFPLDIPQNVEIRGDGQTKTSLGFLPFLWDLGELPERMIGLHGNVYIHDMDFSGSRVRALFGAQNARGIRIERCSVVFEIYAGGPTNTLCKGEEYTASELYRAISNELSFWYHAYSHTPALVLSFSGCEDLTFSHLRVRSEGLGAHQLFGCHNVLLEHTDFGAISGATSSCINAMFLHNRYQCCTGVNGDRVFYAHNITENQLTNNRELMTTDGHGIYGSFDGNVFVWALDDEGRRYRLKYAFPDGSLVGMQLLLLEGAGAGQARRIVGNSGDEIVLSDAFTVAPVSGETKVVIFMPRSNMIFFSNQYQNGSVLQFYGTQLNTVVDSQQMKKVKGIVSRGYYVYSSLQPNWYNSFCANRFSDNTYFDRLGMFKDTYSGGDRPEYGLFLLGNGATTNLQKDVLVRRNVFEDGYCIRLSGPNKFRCDPWNGAIVQSNRIGGAFTGVGVSVDGDGTYITDNVFENVETEIDCSDSVDPGKRNAVGDLCLIVRQ